MPYKYNPLLIEQALLLLKLECVINRTARWLGGQRHLLPSLTTWASYPGWHGRWQETTESYYLPSTSTQ